jgi:hypothetical protein
MWSGSCCMKQQEVNSPEPSSQDDDVWAWVVIGLVFFGVSLALFGPLVWESTHGSL